MYIFIYLEYVFGERGYSNLNLIFGFRSLHTVLHSVFYQVIFLASVKGGTSPYGLQSF